MSAQLRTNADLEKNNSDPYLPDMCGNRNRAGYELIGTTNIETTNFSTWMVGGTLATGNIIGATISGGANPQAKSWRNIVSEEICVYNLM